MNTELSILIERLNDPVFVKTDVITWGCPVPSFGNLASAKIATLGLNPSNREFVDERGKELEGAKRRFHTLNSLGLQQWSDAKENHLSSILDLCKQYFFRNPYDGWFKKLDNIISGTSLSYYFPSAGACHLDLIPYATSCKWTELNFQQRSLLLDLAGDTLGLLLKNSSIKLLILNGQTVVENLQRISNVVLQKTHKPEWTLPRKSNDGVLGYAYIGFIENIGGIDLERKIHVLGYNHNIQSSFGVTTQVQRNIRNWVSDLAKEVLHETC